MIGTLGFLDSVPSDLCLHPMRIAINATCFNQRPSGAKQRFIGMYREVVRKLPESQFTLFEPSDFPVSTWFEKSDNLFHVKTNIPSDGKLRKIFKGHFYWSKALRGKQFSIIERFNLPIIPTRGASHLVTVHDIRQVSSGHLVSRKFYHNYIRRALDAATEVIAVSETVKNEILEYFPSTNVSVVYNGLDCKSIVAPLDEELVKFQCAHRLPSQFLLSIGHFEERKNYVTLIDALGILEAQGLDIPLVIIGNDSGTRSQVQERVTSLGLDSKVWLLSGLSDREVQCAYSLCKAFVFPSSYEGFGIPILEAMAANRAQVLSDIPVFREITENQGVFFSHRDAGAMAHAIEQVVCSSDEESRLVAYGKARLLDFSFDRLSDEIIKIYKRLSFQ